MTAFDTAWRKGKEDANAKTLQEAYDQGGDDFNRFQRWIHVAEPIEVFMPNNDKPQQMERTHIGTNRLADEKGEYVGAEQAMADYQEDLQNLSRKRKNPKDPKYARIFIPNPESKKDDIGDFHIDEAHSDDWQEKLAGEPMTAFDAAFSLLKIDEGMWEEIYAPLLAQTTGMGNLGHAEYASDFVPTQFALDNVMAMNTEDLTGEQFLDELRKPTDTGDHGWATERLAEQILEHGFNPLKIPGQGWHRSGRPDPTFQFDQHGTNQFEGRHRLLALEQLGAPYVPYMGMASNYFNPEPWKNDIKHRQPIGGAFQHMMQNKVAHSLGAYIDRQHLMVPPSFLYGREMVPGMGRLEPVNRLGEPMDMLTHIDDRPKEFDALESMLARNRRQPLNPFDELSVSRNQRLLQDESLRNSAKWDWKKQPSWQVVHDE